MKTIYTNRMIQQCPVMALIQSNLRKIVLLVISISFLINANARNYYVATNGNDANPGTLASPFRNWQRLSNTMVAGDKAYIRGGIYTPTSSPALYIHCLIQNLNGTAGNWITIENYPNEVPVYDFTGLVVTNTDAWAVYFEDCSYLKVKGLRVTGLAQSLGGVGVSRGINIALSSNILLQQIEVDHMGGTGFFVAHSNDVTYLNCDSHHNADPYSTTSPPYGGADGFSGSGGETSTRTVYKNCRAWWNSDDGWDFFSTDGVRTIINCWSFWNGYIPGTFSTGGNGEGYKLGPTATDRSNVITKFLNNCMAFKNRSHGFSQNVGQSKYQIYNCTSYDNEMHGYWWGNYPGIIQDFKNNIAYNNGGSAMADLGQAQGSNNTWNGPFTVTNADFLSVSSLGVDGPRQNDGSLPNLNFLKLAVGSDLIDAGVNVGLPYNGPAPDKGFDEFGTNPLPIHDVALTGKTDNNKHILNWHIIADEPIRTIFIETSTDANNFSVLTSVTPGADKYTYQPFKNSTLFYRLRVTSVLEQTVLSNTVALKGTGVEELIFNVSTLVQSEITINASSNYKYLLSDLNGRKIINGNGIKGLNRININNQPKGMFFISLTGVDINTGLINGMVTKKIVKY
jgi:Right handed beta helix region